VKLLLDTHILLWAAADLLPASAERYITDPANELYFSSVSIWEVVVKRSLNRADFCVDPTILLNGLSENGYKDLSVTARHALLVGSLPQLHKDPFDRLLLAQSISEGMPFLTADETIRQYPGSIIFVR
jgi:PIN domain nuclease of toxin-antitoxin system